MRIRTVLAACALATALAAGTAGTASAADGPTVFDGNNSVQEDGNTVTGGTQSPQIGLVQGSLNRPCVGLAGKVNAGSLLGLIPIAVQDVNVLDSPQNQECADNSSEIQGDEPLSHILSGR